MFGKLILKLLDKTVAYVLRQPEVTRAVDKILNDQTLVPANGPVDFHVEGKRGEVRWASVMLETSFKGEKLAATDTSEKPGMGTVILMTVVHDRVVGFVSDDLKHGSRTAFFAPHVSGSNVRYPLVKTGQWIRYLIFFEEDCAWDAALFGSIPASEVPVNAGDKRFD